MIDRAFAEQRGRVERYTSQHPARETFDSFDTPDIEDIVGKEDAEKIVAL